MTNQEHAQLRNAFDVIKKWEDWLNAKTGR